MDAARAEQLRAEMVRSQLRGRGIADESVLTAMAGLPRERFVPGRVEDLAYADEALPTQNGQTISQPYMVARMTELLAPQPGELVLEIGTGSGYQSAVLASIGCRVLSIERHAPLARAAESRVRDLHLEHLVRIEVGDGSRGRPEEAPFDGILVTAAAPRIPEALPDQLAVGGRLVAPIGRRNRQELVLMIRRPEGFASYDCGPCVFVPLVGEGGYAPDHPPRNWFDRLI
jgi:protein-L-isoaspartate(D-aspartate) O-methyltransferase